MNVKGKMVAILVAGSLAVGAGGTYAGMSLFSDDESNSALEKAAEDSLNLDLGGSGAEEEFAKIEKTYDLISQQYFQKVDKDKLLEGAIQGMVKTLDDPYSVYMDEETAEQFNDTLESSFEGIGAEVTMMDGYVTIVAPFEDSPAEKAGLRPKDQIVSIDGKSTKGLDLYDAVLKIRGKKGSTVKLEVKRPGASETLTVNVKRDEIPIETVYSDVIEKDGKKVGNIRITSFSEDTAADFEKQLKALEDKGIDGLVIDVRGNPGGYLSSVEDIMKLIVKKDEPIVQIEARNGEKQRFFSSRTEKRGYPIVGLIDRGSASASEILAAALKEAGEYELVGEKSFGKGTVQQAVEMDDGSSIKLTMFKWLTPDGNWIHEKGVKPTVEVKQPDYFYASPITVEKPLTFDSNGEQVKNLQTILKGLGFNPGRTDGYFDEKTETAVRAFQNSSNDLKVTGKVDKETARLMEKELLEKVDEAKNDLQLQTAIEVLFEK
ncbi:S41 family peptidase [Pseudalkalibacillus decolorationis]|uniref:S41 family peptidase n=1 Tax=Pseudalkalibacillus decolorationis TaxID=163879 RepID=UPI002147DFDD|nr:S41 family peptidase [Pseudalkalibacillus decolorationis]